MPEFVRPACPAPHTSAGKPARLRGLFVAAVLGALMVSAQATGTLRIAMTASDIPLPNGQTDQGAEGMRFMGYTVFEALVGYDMSSADKPTSLVPGLATDWKVEADKLPKFDTYPLRSAPSGHLKSNRNKHLGTLQR